MMGKAMLMLFAGVLGASMAHGQPGWDLLLAMDLRCEYRANPLGIDTPNPRLSWCLKDGCPKFIGRPGARQSAYQVLVASSPQALKGDLWDSGKIVSDRSVHVPYAGKPLASRQTCFWKVRVWNEFDHVSPWSETARWTIGLLDAGEWEGAYIGMDAEAGAPDCPWLRKTFSLAEAPKEARVYVNSLGYHELFVNGQKVGDAVLSPAVTHFPKRSLYLTYDVAKYLRPGRNCVGLWLGGGWYASGLPGVVHDGPLVRAQLEADLAGGERVCVATDTSWKAHPSSITGVGTWRSQKFGGERVSTAKHIAAWCEEGLDDSGWAKAKAVAVPAHTVQAQAAEPNRVQRRIPAKEVRACGEGLWLVDFGTNLTGLFEARLSGLRPNQRVRFDYADHLDEDPFHNFGQYDTLIAAGPETEVLRNRFNYHGFRYVQITGLDEAPPRDAFHACLVRTDYPVYAEFACSDPALNSVHDMVHYTLRCLSLGGYLVDCPQIERLGYGGDGQASTPTALTMFGMGPLYMNWLAAWRDCQRENGDMPHTAPNPYNAGGGPYWCGFIIAASWHLYQHYADEGILETNYPAMQHWLDDFVEGHVRDGILHRWPNTDYRNWYLGDWARPKRNEKECERSADFVSNCFRIQCLDWMAEIASVLGHAEDAKRYREKAATTRPLVHAAFWKSEGATYADDTQLDLAYPLLAKVAPEALRPELMARLEKKILVEHGGHLDVGLAGVPLLTEQLMAADRNDLVYAYTSKKTFPGWGYMIENGATTTWEHWDAHRSRIHNCYNGIGLWFYRGIAGIRPTEPGFKHVELRPGVVGGLTWARAKQQTVRGEIESHWRIEDGRFLWDIALPPNTTATIQIPCEDASAVSESGVLAKEAKGLRLLSHREGFAIFEIQSGRYAFDATR